MSSTSLALSSPHPTVAARVRGGLRAHPALAVAMAILLVAWAGLVLTHRPTPLALPRSIALRAALIDPASARTLASVHWNHFDVSPMDPHYEILDFYRGSRMVAWVTVGVKGRTITILDVTNVARQSYAFGANVANDPRILALLAAVFVLMTAVWPLWRVRNLDVFAVASLALAVVLYNNGLLSSMVLVCYPALIYLAFRCGFSALGRRAFSAPAVPLYDHLTRRWRAGPRLRMLRLVAAAMTLVIVMVGLTSPNVVDVGYSVMEGATLIVHGVLPYGHIPDVLHGDTYPLASYLLYVPFAWLSPVRTVWDDADATLAVAVVAALFAGAAMWRMVAPLGSRVSAAPSSGETTRLRMAIAVLAFPPLLVTVSTGTTDVALAALLMAMLLLWRRPGWSMAALSAAAWFKAAPVVIAPLVLARLRGRAALKAVAVLVITSGAMIAILVALGGVDAPLRMLSAISFQFTRTSPLTLWWLVGSVPLQQLAEATTVALIAGAVIRLRRDPAFGGDRRRIAAISAAVLLGLQLSANYWTYMYLVWAVPLIVLALLVDPQAVPGPSDPAVCNSCVQVGLDVSTHRPQPPICA